MSDHDPNRLRWGDLFNVTFAGGASENPAPITQQIVNARATGLPETWSVFLFTAIDHDPVGTIPGGVSYTMQFNIVLGIGASPVTFPFTFFFGGGVVGGPLERPYEILSSAVVANPPVILFGYKQLVIPARDIQINCLVTRSGDDARNIQVGAWVAPYVPAPLALPGHAPPEHQHQWMQSGFHPEALRYK